MLGDDFHQYWPASGGVDLPDAEELRLQYVALSRSQGAIYGNGLFGAMQGFLEASGGADMAARVSQITGASPAAQGPGRGQAGPAPG